MTELAPGLHSRTGIDVDPLAYDRYTGRWSRLFVPDTIAAASVRQGDKVLDMSTGTGEAAIGLLSTIGGPGTVIGADISPEMARAPHDSASATGAICRSPPTVRNYRFEAGASTP